MSYLIILLKTYLINDWEVEFYSVEKIVIIAGGKELYTASISGQCRRVLRADLTWRMIYGCNCKNPNSAFQKITQFNRGKEKNVGVNIYTKFFMYTIEKKKF